MKGLVLVPLLACLSIPTHEPKPMPARDVYAIGLGSLVDVYTFHMDGEPISFGSGSVIGHDAKGKQVVITAAHLFRHEQVAKTKIVVAASVDMPHKATPPCTLATIVQLDAGADLALLTLTDELPRSYLHTGPAAKQTDPIFWMGNPAEAPTSFGPGVVTKVADKDAQYSGFAWPGISGGMILNEFGQLVGVISAVNVVEDETVEEPKRVLIPQIGYFVQIPAIDAILAKGAIH